MAADNVIKTITIRGSADGVDELTKQVNSLASGMDNVTAASEKQEKATLSAETALKRLQTRYDQEFRAQQSLAQVQKTLDQARAQGLITQDRANVLMQQAIRYHNTSAQSVKVHQAALEELSSAAQGLVGNLGSVGGFLARLGPAGLAAAAGAAALAIGFKVSSQAALDLAEKAGRLRDFSDTTGFTVKQLQALTTAGAQVGLSSEDVARSLERFAASFDSIKTASGPVYQTLLQIDPALAKQISRATSLTEAYDLYAQALDKADLSQRNVLARQVGGRQGIGATRLTAQVAEAGGVDALVAKMNQLDFITDKQAKTWDDLGDTIKENLEKIKTNIVSTFAEPALRSMQQMSETLLEFSRSVKSFDWENSWLPKFASWVAYLIPTVGPLKAVFDVVNSLQGGGGAAPTKITVSGAGIIGPQLPPDVAAQIKEQAQQQQFLRDETIRTANEYGRFVQILGSSATPAQQLKNQLLQLDKAVAENGDETTKAAAAQAKSVLQSQYSMNQEEKRISLLGNLATVQDAVTLTQNKITRAAQEGVSVGKDQEKQLLRISELQAISQKSSGVVSALGDATTATEEYAAAFDKLNVAQADTTITQEQFRRGLINIKTGMQDVRQFSSQFSNGAVSALSDIATGAKNAGDAFKDFGNQVLKALTDMILKITVFNQLEKSLSLGIGQFLPTPAAATPTTTTTSSVAIGIAHGGGVIGTDVFPRFLASLDSWNNAPRFQGGGMVGGGVPILAHAGEGVFTPGQMAALGRGNQTVNVNVQNAPSTPHVEQTRGPGGELNVSLIFDQFEGRLADNMRRGKGPLTAATGGRFGLNPARGNALGGG